MKTLLIYLTAILALIGWVIIAKKLERVITTFMKNAWRH